MPDVVITAASLADVWPEVSHRLTKLLVSRGASFDVVDDVVQEVAARALARGVTFTDAPDLMRWAVPVSLNLLVDNARAAQRVTYDTAPEESVPDVADLVVHRERVGRVLHAVASLSPADRAALTGYGDDPADRREAVKLAVRRHRARRRLLALVDGVAGLLVALLRRMRSAAPAAAVAVALPVAFLATVPAQPRTVVVETTRAPLVSYEPVSPVVHASRRPVVTAPATSRAHVAPARRPAAPQQRPVVQVGRHGTGFHVEERQATHEDGLVCVRHLEPVPVVCVF